MSRPALLVAFTVGVLLWGCGGDTAGGPRGSGETGVDPSLGRALQATLDQQREFHELPGAAAAVVIPGQGVWSGGSGVADRKTAMPVTGHTPFAIASLTKPFIAALAIKLSGTDRLQLDDRLSDFVPQVVEREPDHDPPLAQPHQRRVELRHRRQRFPQPRDRRQAPQLLVAAPDAELRAQAILRAGRALAVQQRELPPRRACHRARDEYDGR